MKCAIVSIRSLYNSLNLKDKIQSYLQTLLSAYPRHRSTNYKKRKKISVWIVAHVSCPANPFYILLLHLPNRPAAAVKTTNGAKSSREFK